MSLEQIEKEEEYEVGSPMMFSHKPWSCMSSCQPLELEEDDISYDYYSTGSLRQSGKTGLLIGERLLIDEAP